MATKSKGRGTAAAFGLLLLFAGLIGGAVLFLLAGKRYDDAVSSFARAPVGCTTTLEFSETGTFYVYREDDGLVDPPDGGCEPTADPLQAFGFELSGPAGAVVPRRDDSISYDTDEFTGTSVARIEIEQPGEYELVVVGDDELLVAAVGRDPDEGVTDLRRRAIAAAVAGVVLGVLLLVLAGWRSKRASTYAVPDAPTWGAARAQGRGGWGPAPTGQPQVPVNPYAPDGEARVTPPPPPLPSRSPGATSSPWAPPATDGPVADAPPPPPPPPAPATPLPTPELPSTPGRASGTSPDSPPPGPGERATGGERPDG